MCATPSPTIVRVTEQTPPPSAFLTPCEKPSGMPLETNRDLARLANELSFRLDVCAAQIAALRVYYGLDGEPEPE